MADVNWPSSPTAGDRYNFNGNYWVYTTTGAWRMIATGGQVSTNWTLLEDYVYDAITVWTPMVDYNWTVLDYV